MTTFAARHVALEGDDSEPEGIASAWDDGPAPRRAMLPDETVTGDAPYEEAATPVPSRTMLWHLAASSNAPLDPGPADAVAPANGPQVDPASVPTPVTQCGAFAYQPLPSPSPYPAVLTPPPYSSLPAQGTSPVPMASSHPCPVPGPYAAAPADPVGSGISLTAGTGTSASADGPSIVGSPVTRMVLTGRRIVSLVVLALILSGVVVTGTVVGGQAWWMVAAASGIALLTVVQVVRPRRA